MKMQKIEIELDVHGLDEAKEALDIEKESTVFEADLGNGVTFKGTKSDYDTFINGIILMNDYYEKFKKRKF